MKNKPKKEEFQEIEKQLRCPTGANGIKMAEMMNAINIGMTTATIKALQITTDDVILEIGHGNCEHLHLLFEENKTIHYHGLEISKTMQHKAQEINKKLVSDKQAFFGIYDGINIPYPPHYFSKIMTVNTLYFWKEAIVFLNEIYRVLQPKGTFILTFADKDFMQDLPFVKDKFILYTIYEIEKIIAQSKLSLLKIIKKTEQVKSKNEEVVIRDFYLIKTKK